MDKLFYPQSIVIMGLSRKPNNVPRIILENLIRWGYMGRIFGVNPSAADTHVDGVRMHKKISELPMVPDLCVALIPARFIPDAIEDCGRFGIKWMAIPSGGFNEIGEKGRKLADEAVSRARKYGVRFVGPNGLTVANTANGLCLPFIPLYSPPKGGLSLITQSGGLGLMLWNLMTNENVGMAKFASIGNKLDLDEIDFLKYFAKDPETRVIGMYLESISNGRKLIETAESIDKPVIIYKSSITPAGNRAAMSHTAAVAGDEAILDTAFERAGIIRIRNFSDFISMAKVFSLPPLKGDRLMVMSPAGGFTVILADLCEKAGFRFADPGADFYENLKKYANAGVINFTNPLDMGDIYDPEMYAHVFFSVLHNDNVDGAVYLTQWPNMPRGEDVFTRLFNTDISKETIGALQSSGKPMGVCLYGNAKTLYRIKEQIRFPLFTSPEEMINALAAQKDFYAKKAAGPFKPGACPGMEFECAKEWLAGKQGTLGEESLELMAAIGIQSPDSVVCDSPETAVSAAESMGYPVVLKVVSPDALHKSEAGGVIVGLESADAVRNGFEKIRKNLFEFNERADFRGVRVVKMAQNGHDMFIGAKMDSAFGPILFFGYGGIYVEIFNDTASVLCPSSREEIMEKLTGLKSYKLLSGARGQSEADVDAFVDTVLRVSLLAAQFPQILELDLNPVRVTSKKGGVMALDARMVLK